MGRFINADAVDTLVATLDDVTDKNLFAYCGNNPVVRHDPDGKSWSVILALSGKAALAAILSNPAFLIAAVAVTVVIVGAVVYAEHTKNKRPSTKNKHQKGKARKGRDAGGEKGDARRNNPWGRQKR